MEVVLSEAGAAAGLAPGVRGALRPSSGCVWGGVPVWPRGFLETSRGKGIRPAGGPDAHTPAGSYHPLSAGGEAFSFKYSPGKLRGNQYKKMMTKEELEEEQR